MILNHHLNNLLIITIGSWFLYLCYNVPELGVLWLVLLTLIIKYDDNIEPLKKENLILSQELEFHWENVHYEYCNLDNCNIDDHIRKNWLDLLK